MSQADTPAAASEAGPAGEAAAGAAGPAGEAATGTAGAAAKTERARERRWEAGLWRSELRLVFARRRTIALLILLALVPVLAAVAVKAFGAGNGGGPTFVGDITHNAVFASLAGLTIVVGFPLPLAVAVVAGDAIAGEAGMGTLRYLLLRPAGRTRLLTAKLGAVAVFCVAAALVVACAGLVIGSILFPLGRVTTLSGFTISLPAGIGRVFEAAGIVGVSMLGLAAIGVFVSTLTEAGLGAMAATLGVFIMTQIIDSVPQLSPVHPELFVRHWESFANLLQIPPTYGAIEADLLLQLCWSAVFVAAAWARFTTADILA